MLDWFQCLRGSHDWSEWRFRGRACEQERVCLRVGCDKTEQRQGHEFGPWHYVAPRSCDEVQVCVRCGAENHRQGGHRWRDWHTPGTGTCRQIQRCMRCPAQNEREVHSWSAWEYRESHLSGVAGQYCEGIRSCTRCGITETSQIGHDWSVWEYETPCSCNLVRHCARCAYRQSRNAEAAEHDWGPWTANSDRECYSRVRVCRHCGRREERREQEPVHQWGEWQIIVPGQLLRRRVCRNCGFREDRSD